MPFSRSLFICVCFSLAICGAVAQEASRVVTTNGGRNAIYTQTPRLVPSSNPELANLTPIYSTLGPANNRYNAIAGTGILGTNAGQPLPQRVANGFTPTANHTVTAIAVAGTYVSGTNSLIVTLADDNSGTPGTTLHEWKFSNLPTFGTCCVLEIGHVSPGIALSKGKMYWLVLEPSSRTSDTYDVWNNDFNNVQGPFNNDIGSGWQGQSVQQLGGFGIFGN